ncbi:hypothetical protein Tco_1411256 [Tanacetum coccineum]
MIYIDIPDYPPPAPPVQTPPSPEWTSGSLPISPSSSDDPLPISSPMIPLTVPSPVATPAVVETELGAQVQMHGGLISDHAVRLEDTHTFLFWNGLPRMGRAEMVDQARFAWGFLSVFGNANFDRVAITSRTGSYPDNRLRQ